MLALVAGVGGAVALLIGYFGVSGTLDPAKQLPYLISGGVGGLFLLGVAAALLFSADLGATRADIARLHGSDRPSSRDLRRANCTPRRAAPVTPLMTDWLPFVISGLVVGSIYAIAAMGLVVTYRTTGLFNFAHGATGMAVAYGFYQLREESELPTPLAVRARARRARAGARHR